MPLLPVLPRRLQPELMDQPGLDPHRHRQALAGLRRVNFWSGSARILWPPLTALARAVAPRPVRLLDLATGGGDVPIRLWHKARRAGLPVVIEGCDVNAVAVEHATGRAKQCGANVRFFTADALQGELPAGYDAVVCSLFLHHLTEDQAVGLLRRMGAAAGRLVLVNDLLRSRVGLLLARIGTHLLSRSEVVHVDGPRSVQGAFTVEEARALAERAGLSGATVERRWPCRFLLTRVRP
jgi:2-polyprenyl-3-methyl-5-hydroxy-6-metoxy-1,4-benzoquinol methylase